MNILAIELWWRPVLFATDGHRLTEDDSIEVGGEWRYNLVIDSFGMPRPVITDTALDADGHGPGAWPWDVLRYVPELEGVKLPLAFTHTVIFLNPHITVHNFSVQQARTV